MGWVIPIPDVFSHISSLLVAFLFLCVHSSFSYVINIVKQLLHIRYPENYFLSNLSYIPNWPNFPINFSFLQTLLAFYNSSRTSTFLNLFETNTQTQTHTQIHTAAIHWFTPHMTTASMSSEHNQKLWTQYESCFCLAGTLPLELPAAFQVRRRRKLDSGKELGLKPRPSDRLQESEAIS